MEKKKEIIEELEKKVYVFRRYYHYYQNLGGFITSVKCLSSASVFTVFVYLPLAVLSLCSLVLDTVENTLEVHERKQEYMISYKFYKELLNLYKSDEITETELTNRENDL